MDRRGLIPGDLLLAAGISKGSSKDLVFVPVQQKLVWAFSGRESGAIVLTLEQKPHWRRLLEAASSALARAVEAEDRESSLKRRAEVGEMVRVLCQTLFCSSDQTPAATLRAVPGLFEAAAGDCECELFLSDSRGSCIDSAGVSHSLSGLVREAFTGAPQICPDTASADLVSSALDCGGRSDVRSVVVLPVFSIDELACVMVFRFRSPVSTTAVSLCRSLVEGAAAFLTTWCSRHRNELGKTQFNLSTHTISETTEILRSSIQSLLAAGEQALDSPQLLDLIARSLECEWSLIFLYDHSKARLLGGARDVIDFDELKGALRENIETMTDVNRVPLIQAGPVILNGVDTRQSGLQTLLKTRLNPYCHCLAFQLLSLSQVQGRRSEDRVFAMTLCGRSWGAFATDKVETIVSNLSGIYSSLLTYRELGSSSNEISRALASERDLREIFSRNLEVFRNRFAKWKCENLTANAFRSQLLTAIKALGNDSSLSGMRFEPSLLVFGTLSNSRWDLGAEGDWIRDRSFSRALNQSDVLQCFHRKSRRFLLFESNFYESEVLIVLEVKAVGDDTSILPQLLPQLAAVLSSVLHIYQEAIMNQGEPQDELDPLRFMPDMIEEFVRNGQFSNTKTILDFGNSNSKIRQCLPIYIDSDGGMMDVRHDSRAIPADLRASLQGVIHKKLRFFTNKDDRITSLILEYLHTMGSTIASDVIACMHTCTSAVLSCSVICICLYDESSFVTPISLTMDRRKVVSRASLYMVLQIIRPHIAPLAEHNELKTRNSSFKTAIADLSEIYGIKGKNDDVSEVIKTICRCAGYHSRLLLEIVQALSQRGQRELVTEVIRSLSAPLLEMSDRNDIVVHWTIDVPPLPTAGLISSDMVEMVRSSGRVLEMDVNHPSLSHPAPFGVLRTKNAKILYLPIYPREELKLPKEVLGVTQLILPAGTSIDGSPHLSLLQSILQSMATDGPQTVPSGGCLSTIVNTVTSAADVQTLRAFMDTSFASSFGAFLAERLRATCGIFTSSSSGRNAVQGQARKDFIAAVSSWNDGAAQASSDIEGLPVKVLREVSSSEGKHSLLPQSLITKSNLMVSSTGVYCSAFRLLEDSEEEAFLIVESTTKPSAEDRRCLLWARDLYLLLHSYVNNW